MQKKKDLLIITLIYLFAFAVGAAAAALVQTVMLQLFVFDIAATVVVFVFSVLYHNSSVYDPYWSVTPMFMSVWLFIREQAFSPMQLLLLIVFNAWGLRLTLNWISVFTDFSYEDWRYRHYRAVTPKPLWQVVNFCGIHLMPTLVVFAGMLPLFEIAKTPMSVFALPGILVIALGIALEYYADRQMHAFLAETKEKVACRNGLWSRSRHPNYLGEITVWLGVYLAMLPFAPEKWVYGAGALSIAVMFNVVSIPLMEKRQMSRRADYQQYRQTTPRLLILPGRGARTADPGLPKQRFF